MTIANFCDKQNGVCRANSFGGSVDNIKMFSINTFEFNKKFLPKWQKIIDEISHLKLELTKMFK